METNAPKKRKNPLVMILACLAGALLNNGISTLCQNAGGVPLYLDTVCTVALTFYGGLLWGLLTGALTNLIMQSIWITGWPDYLFALCNMAAALLTFLFIRLFPRELSLAPAGTALQETALPEAAPFPGKSRRLNRLLDRVVVLVFLSFASSVVLSLLGGLIAVIIKYRIAPALGGEGPEVFFRPVLLRKNLPAFFAEILSRIPVNIIDRLVSAFAGYGIAALLARLRARVTLPRLP
jgi:hypothetical protein